MLYLIIHMYIAEKLQFWTSVNPMRKLSTVLLLSELSTITCRNKEKIARQLCFSSLHVAKRLAGFLSKADIYRLSESNYCS